MKICTDCQFHKRSALTHPQSQQPMMMDVCVHKECQDAIVGGPIPAMMARQQQVYCGFEAKYFKLKESEPKATDSNVIQLK